MEDFRKTMTMRRSARSRRIRITVRRDGTVLVTRPLYVSQKSAERFVVANESWIIETVRKCAPSRAPRAKPTKEIRREALSLIVERLLHFNTQYNFRYGNVSAKDQRSRWGSCSRRGNLNFNYRILFLPPEERDYVIVHELCHLKEMNHGPAFWQLVAKTVPDYAAIRRKLRARRMDDL